MEEETNTYNYLKGLALRFLRGFIAGAVGSMVAIPVVAKSFPELVNSLTALVFIGLAGGITGGLLALDKYVRT